MQGAMYVSCDSGCLPLPLVGLAPPILSATSHDYTEETPKGTLEQRGGSKPCEGGAAEEGDRSVLIHVGVPLKAVLLSLWEGGPIDDG